MKVGKLNSRVARFGQKLKGDINSAVGKTSTVIRQGERGIVKGINAVADVADSKQVIWFELTRESWLTFRAKFDYDKDWGGNPTGQMPSPNGEIS